MGEEEPVILALRRLRRRIKSSRTAWMRERLAEIPVILWPDYREHGWVLHRAGGNTSLDHGGLAGIV